MVDFPPRCRRSLPDSGGALNPFRLALHGAMLADMQRNRTLARAVEASVRPGDTVIDVGAGSGLLSLLAARAGARKVYAIESGGMVDVARCLVALNGFSETISLVASDSHHWSPPEKAQMIICETLGFAVFEEGFRSSLADARDRMLAPGGLLLPERVRVLAVPVGPLPQVPNLAALGQILDFDYSPLPRLLCGTFQRAHVPFENELAKPSVLCNLDCYSMNASGPLESEVAFEINRPGILAGHAIWFDADLGGGVQMSSRCPEPSNHWGQTFLGAAVRNPVESGNVVHLKISVQDVRHQFDMRWSEWAGGAE
jgi:hypothetical protein